jgi:hypothetical protein
VTAGGGAATIAIRRGLLLVAAATMVTALLAGLARLGVLVGWGPRFAFAHGPLMVIGVFTIVIALERAVAIARGWAFVAPALAATAAVAMLAGAPGAAWPAGAATVALVAVNLAIVRRQPASFTLLMLLGSVALAAGTAAWAHGEPVFAVTPAWMAFFVLTIAAERLELSGLGLARPPRWAATALVVASLACALAAAAPLARHPLPARIFGGAIAAVGLWQLAFDVARRTIRRHGLPRFTAAGILLGALWLVAGGALIARRGLPPAGPLHDAGLHAVLVGYVLSMIFAHAPIILQAVARAALPYHPTMWIALAVLHVGLALRIAGDLALDDHLRQHGAIASAAALALFAAATVAGRLRRGKSAHPR